MSAAFNCLPKISPCRHAEGRKTRRAVFLGPLILTTCLRGKVDGPGTDAAHHYVPGSRTSAGHAAGSRLPRRPSGHGGALSCGHPSQRHAASLEGLGHPAVQVSGWAGWRDRRRELGERLLGGNQAATEAVLQRGHRLPPSGASRRPDQRDPRGEPLQWVRATACWGSRGLGLQQVSGAWLWWRVEGASPRGSPLAEPPPPTRFASAGCIGRGLSILSHQPKEPLWH